MANLMLSVMSAELERALIRCPGAAAGAGSADVTRRLTVMVRAMLCGHVNVQAAHRG
ncbi:hypothetical protein V9L19_13645 [Pseudarthrobacter sp. CCNWLW247]